jgi:hypothetical protein
MGLVQPPRPRGSLVDRFRELGPGGQVQRGAGSVAAALARAQMEGLDPRSWNDRVTPAYDEAGRPISAGVMFPRNPLNLAPLEKIFRNRGELKLERPDFRDKELLGAYGDDAKMGQFNADEADVKQAVLADIFRGHLGPLGGDRPGLPVSWDGPRKPLPPPPVKQALDELLTKIRPKQGKQIGVWDGEQPFGHYGISPLEHDNPGLFRKASASEEWVANEKYDVGGNRLPGIGNRGDATSTLQNPRLGRVDNQRLRRVRDDIRVRRDEGVKMPPPPNPNAYHENYFRGAELNFVPKKPTIVQQLQRISRGRRGGV